MFDILTALQYGELTDLRGKAPLEAPYTIAEERVLRQLLQRRLTLSSKKYRP